MACCPKIKQFGNKMHSFVPKIKWDGKRWKPWSHRPIGSSLNWGCTVWSDPAVPTLFELISCTRILQNIVENSLSLSLNHIQFKMLNIKAIRYSLSTISMFWWLCMQMYMRACVHVHACVLTHVLTYVPVRSSVSYTLLCKSRIFCNNVNKLAEVS